VVLEVWSGRRVLITGGVELRVCALRLTNTIGPRMRIKDARQTLLGV
jgi:UDP-glucose 4-epimerase